MPFEDMGWYNIGSGVAGALVGAVVTIITIIRKFRVNSKKPADDQKFSRIHTTIHERLSELRVRMLADRAIIAQFHNGGYLATGTSLRKFSVTHESTGLGFMPTIPNGTDQVVSNFIYEMKMLTDDDPRIHSNDDLPPNTVPHKMHAALNVTSFASLPLYDTDGMNMIGFIKLMWVDNNDEPEEALDADRFFREQRDNIAILLMDELARKTRPKAHT